MMSPSQPARAGGKSYDQTYFTRWYRDPRTRVHSPEAVERKVRMVLGITEYLMRRKLRSVLDVGAGEGTWGTLLRRLRPGVRYQGVDPSEWVVRRHGIRRNIMLGAFADLARLPLASRYDLIVCADVIQYIPTPVLERGVQYLGKHLAGVSYLESYTTADEMEGDLEGWHPRSKREYLRIYKSAGLVPCGLHCYTTADLASNAVELELA